LCDKQVCVFYRDEDLATDTTKNSKGMFDSQGFTNVEIGKHRNMIGMYVPSHRVVKEHKFSKLDV
jgi:hypothetical protein